MNNFKKLFPLIENKNKMICSFKPKLSKAFFSTQTILSSQRLKKWDSQNKKFNANITVVAIKIESIDRQQKREMSGHRDMKRKIKKMMKEQGGEAEMEKNTPKNIPKPSGPMMNSMMNQNLSKEQKINQNIYFGSLTKIIDDYAPPSKHPSLLSIEGLKSRKKHIQNYFISWYFWWQMRNKNPGNRIDRKNFLITAEKIYLTFNQGKKKTQKN